ncbi:MAG: four helix bundle protein [Candidatus Bipolaricaulota bacterium]|nr:four helix bundle protein [Candidatus Bipolaricaulota bacterium]
MRPHRKLDVWNEAVSFVVDVYQVTRSFPKMEQHALADQLKRAAVSIPSNIAEGAARQTKKEFIQFLYIAQGSASEIDTQLEVARRLNYIDEGEKARLDHKLGAIGKMLTGLIRSLKKA